MDNQEQATATMAAMVEALQALTAKMDTLQQRLDRQDQQQFHVQMPQQIQQQIAANQMLQRQTSNQPLLPQTPIWNSGSFHPDEQYYVRIKPYNPRRGHLRMRQYFKEIGRILKGGDGQPGSIPVWCPVTGAEAQALASYRQDDEDPMSPPVLDIVTEEEMKIIENAEQAQRLQAMGIAGLPPTEALISGYRQAKAAVMQREASPTPEPPRPPVVRQPPSIMAGAEHYLPTAAAPAPQQPQIAATVLPVVAPPMAQQPTEQPVYDMQSMISRGRAGTAEMVVTSEDASAQFIGEQVSEMSQGLQDGMKTAKGLQRVAGTSRRGIKPKQQ